MGKGVSCFTDEAIDLVCFLSVRKLRLHKIFWDAIFYNILLISVAIVTLYICVFAIRYAFILPPDIGYEAGEDFWLLCIEVFVFPLLLLLLYTSWKQSKLFFIKGVYGLLLISTIVLLLITPYFFGGLGYFLLIVIAMGVVSGFCFLCFMGTKCIVLLMRDFSFESIWMGAWLFG